MNNRAFANGFITNCQNRKIKIIQKDKLHEKLLIIDDRIAYVGSLNILSHRDQSEMMLKISSPNTIKELLKIYTI